MRGTDGLRVAFARPCLACARLALFQKRKRGRASSRCGSGESGSDIEAAAQQQRVPRHRPLHAITNLPTPVALPDAYDNNTEMAVNFAPYQSSPPEHDRVRSPPLRSPTTSPNPQQQQQRAIGNVADRDDPWAAARAQRLPSPSRYTDDEEGAVADSYQDIEGQRFRNDYIGSDALQGGGVTYNGSGSVFETSLGLPLNIEAMLAYLVLPPCGGVVLLLFEHKSDYVRFHAWQSALLFSMMFLIHIIFSWTSILSYLLLACDLCMIGFLAFGAWRHGDTLDRVEVPFLGRLASSFVDDE